LLVWSGHPFLRHKCIYQNLSDDTPCQKLLLYVYFHQYDRSGRSLGVAYVQFSNPKDAKAAVDRLNGVPAKGKPMNLTFDSGRKGPGFGRLPPTGPKAASLINRIASAPLIDRVARAPNDSEANMNTHDGQLTGGKNARSSGRVRPGKSSGGGGGKGNKPARFPKTPKTAEELDRELEAYLVNDNARVGPPAVTNVPTMTDGGLVTAAEDVEMA